MATCKGIWDSLGFGIPNHGLRIPGTGFQPLWVERGFLIPIVIGIPDPLSCIPDSKAQDFRFHKEKFSAFPDMRRDNIIIKQSWSWSWSWNELRKNHFQINCFSLCLAQIPCSGLENRHSTQVGCCYPGGPAQTTATSHEGLRTRTLLASISCGHVHSAKRLSSRACDSFYFRVLWNVTFTDAWLLYNSKR